MTTEFLGENAVRELFDIIAENYVSQEEMEKREKSMASATSVGSALLAVSLLKIAEAIIIAKGAAGGEELIASDDEIDDVLDDYFDLSTDTSTTRIPVSENDFATDEEVDDEFFWIG